jgi:hypothetical protein
MAIEVANYDCSEAIPVSYFLCKVIEKEFEGLKESVRKDGLPSLNINSIKSPDDNFLLDLDAIIKEELRHLKEIIIFLEGILSELGIRSQDTMDNRKRYLKRFIESLNNLSNKEELSLCHQLLDFVL